MGLKRRVVAGLIAGALLLGAAVTGLTAAGQVPARAVPAQDQRLTRTVTLVTGDRVTVWGDTNRVSVEPGPGRQDVMFATQTDGGRMRVVPSDAAPLLAAGRLDPRLFDVTMLLEFGYDRREGLPLIVTGGRGAGVSVAGAARASVAGVDGLAVARELPAVGGVAVRQSRAKAAQAWRGLSGGGRPPRRLRAGVSKVWLDGLRKPSLDISVPQVGAPAAWAAGFTGAGVTVAVLDTGVDDTHPDLAGRVTARRNFTEGFDDDRDLAGHGTHVASTVAGSGAASDGRYQGVAPGAKLVDGKVCVSGGCAESWILAGMEWAAVEQHARVANLSLGGEDDPGVVDPLEQAVQTLTDQYGTLFVIAAGNTDGGIAEGYIDSPGSADAALTVGAVNDADALADFSRRGPRPPDDGLKPDITAPGVDITAARGTDATRVPGGPDDRYTTLSGTSMATPHVAGAAAILAQQHPDWSGQQLKAALMASARPNQTTGVYAQGAGRLDVARAVGQSVTSNPASVSFGRQMWPHTDDPVLTRNVTYHNDGTTDVTLALRVAAFGPGGAPTPEGMFTLGATSIRVPARGDATVAVTADTRLPGPDGYVGGWLTATAGDLAIRTPVAVNKEVESYDVTLTHLDRAGATPYFFTAQLTKRDGPYQITWDGPDPGGTVTLRVPKGHYTVVSVVDTTDGAGAPAEPGGKPEPPPSNFTLLAQPNLDVNQPRTVTLDARLGQPISVTVPQPSARQVYADMGAGSRTAGQTVRGESFANLYTARIGPDQHDDHFFSHVAGQWAQANPDGGTDDSPYLYILFYPVRGQMVTGYQRSVTNRELARVRADFSLAQPDTLGEKRVSTGVSDLDSGNFGPWLRFHLPFTRTEYYNTDPGVESAGDFREWSGDDVLAYSQTTSYIHYEAGRTHHERWNSGVFAPSLAAPLSFGGWQGVTRAADTIGIEVPLFSDGAGHPGVSGRTTSSSATLFRNGTKVGDIDPTQFGGGRIDVAPDDAAYRLEVQVERDAPYILSTKTAVTWTFRSGHVDGSAPVPLALWAIRFTPELDRYNTAPAGRVHPVALTMTPQLGAAVGRIRAVSVEASFDDGATWTRVPVRDGSALVRHPRGDGFVSLRAKASDTAGNTVEQTIIHAYRYG